MTNYLSYVKTGDQRSRSFLPHAITTDMGSNTERPFADIAERIRWHRALEGLDQRDYAKRAGVSRSALNNWESGDYRLSLDGALKLRRTFGLSLDFMYEGISDALPMSLRQAWRDRDLDSRSK